MIVRIGVDSGGTRSTVKMVGPDGASLLQYESKETLDGVLSPEEYASTIRHLLARCGAVVGELGDPQVQLFIAASGFCAPTRDDFTTAILEAVPAVLGGTAKSAAAANDAVVLLLAYRASVAAIAGTGSIVLVQSSDGVRQAGGHEWIACDQGSGFWIGLRAMRQAYNDLESHSDSVLLQRLYEHFALPIGDKQALVDRAYHLAIDHRETKRNVARFASSVCGAAQRGDEVAQDIVKREAEEFADLAAGAFRRYRAGVAATSPQPDTGVLCGGLLSNSFYRRAFENQVTMRLTSSPGDPSPIDWTIVTNGVDAAVALAGDLGRVDEELLALETVYRPVVVNF